MHRRAAAWGCRRPPLSERDLDQLQESSPRTVVPLTPRVLCEKCVHGASVIFDNHPLCGDCFLTESRKALPTAH
jgi:hypothetical protein